MDYEKLALQYHAQEPAGKIQIKLTKDLNTQEDLAIAYSPGVAGPCREIAADKNASYLYTGRSNLVAVISNGTAVLGLGDIGPAAAKPVMEGKAMLFKKFADIDVFDLELDAKDPDAFIAAVKALEPTFGGINLEDIKAPECFYIEEQLVEKMDIPVFHDDQHGTAIIASAAFLNALEITQRDIKSTKVVFSGGGAAAIACADLFLKLGVRRENLIMCDRSGVIYEGRAEGMNPYKARFANATPHRTLEQALVDADAFVGVSGPGVVSGAMIKPMAKNPIIFALANPDPEITPDEARKARPDAIVATGRSDYPNQVNNVLGFPFIFRGALDVRARKINTEMKLAAVYAIAALAKEDVPEEVLRVYHQSEGYQFGRDYLIPKPVDSRALLRIAPAVAKAAMDSGVARQHVDLEAYQERIEKILGPTRRMVRSMRKNIVGFTKKAKQKPRIVLPWGTDPRSIKAAAQVYYEGDVEVTLLGSPQLIHQKAASLGFKNFEQRARIIDPAQHPRFNEYVEEFYRQRQRKGIPRATADQLMRSNSYFATMMTHMGDADGVITGLVEPFVNGVKPILEIIGTEESKMLTGIAMIVYHNKLYFVADCTVHIEPTPEELCRIALTAADVAKAYSKEPVRLAMLSFSSFGSNRHPNARKVAEASEMLRAMKPNFNFDGEMQADVALNSHLRERDFPFCNLTGDANVLVFPDLTAANICAKILSNLTDAHATGPLLIGPKKPAHVLERGAATEDLINMIYLTADQFVRTQNHT